MSTTIQQSIRENGVVGAGGAGFPTYVKLQKEAEYLILNGAECEPLLHKDKELMKKFGQEILEGLRLIGEQIGAKHIVLGIKGKYTEVIDGMRKILASNMQIHPLGDYYPAGDEFVLVYEVTGRAIPPGGLPGSVGCAVVNVETALNVARNKPVTKKYLTVAGAVAEPKTLCLPIGTTFREAIDLCGGATTDPFSVLVGGIMMGRLAESLDTPITKTTGGLLVFADDHIVIQRYKNTFAQINQIGKSACDQCFHCTELCPRYLLGHPIEPHKAMRALGFSQDKLNLVIGTQFCCECNLCSLIACPEILDPKNVCTQNKRELKANNQSYPDPVPNRGPHVMREGRSVPLSRLFLQLGLRSFDNRGPLSDACYQPGKVSILLQQHVGAPASPVCAVGDTVREGDAIARVADDALGVTIHASIDGTVTEITETTIEITKQ